jgi:acyl-CoA reductase-like NAD-dependent aldehyde dehydrogenase
MHYAMLIGGDRLEAEGGRTLPAWNPYTGEQIAAVPDATAADVEAAVRAPFGGVGKSGHGRERGEESLDEYLRTKNVMIDLNPGLTDLFPVEEIR